MSMKGWTENAINKLTKKDAADHFAICPAGSKRDGRNALGAAAAGPKLDAPCYLSVVIYKTGENWDADNISTKGILDGIVKSGIIGNDTIKEVPQIIKRGVRVGTEGEERTVIELFEV